MITTPSIRLSTISRLLICYVTVVIITMPGSHLIASANNDGLLPTKHFFNTGFKFLSKNEVPKAMFNNKEQSSQFTEAAVEAESRIRDFFMDAEYQHALFAHFNGNRKQPTAAWIKKAAQLKALVVDKKFNLTIQLIPSSEMDFMMSAFISKGKNGQPLALINRNWIEYGITHEAFTRLIIEQSAFAFDQFLNAENDTKGNEGKAFANDLSSIYEEASETILPGYITLGGRRMLVEY